jgi:ACS family tartrate transporter-like MFS transporter
MAAANDSRLSVTENTTETRTMRKIRVRILPLVFLLYFIAFLDRANVAYAKLMMSADLGFSEAVYGLGAGLFFLGYFVLEIPGALIVQRWGARRWMARILITWGFCTVMIGFIHTAHQFYTARLLLGAAEAGFYPGIIVYLNEWFPSLHRARAISRFVMASPIALALGGPLSGFILKLQWFNMPGWRWVFILQGVPAVLAGVAVLFIMTDRPKDAKWLQPQERDWLGAVLEAERRAKRAAGRFSIGQALRHPTVLLLCLIIFLANIGIQGFFLWLPTTVQRASGYPPYLSAMISGLPFLIAVAAQACASWSSDRRGERCLHAALPLVASAIIFPVTCVPGLSFGWLLFWLCCSSAAIYGFGPPFWVLPTVTMGEAAGAAAVGFINCFSGLGGFVGPVVVGKMLTGGYSFSQCVFFLSACFLGAGLVTFVIRKRCVLGMRALQVPSLPTSVPRPRYDRTVGTS